MVFIEGSTDMFWPIVLLLVLTQVFDNNIIEPLAEGERLHIGPIWTIIALVIGELIWGVAGMIIFMPLVAIIKIICDHIPTLQPYAYLLNNEIPSPKLLKYARSILQRKKKTE
jgi:predicted PurR-regulated permease PerM